MSLDRDRIVDHAFELLRDQGLGALSMRRLAAELGVAPGAIYWHVLSKQDLLAEVAERIVGGLGPALADALGEPGSEQVLAVASALRGALLDVRDGADVVSVAMALRPDGLQPVRDVARLFAESLPPRQAEWAAQTLVHFVLGTVAEEQNRGELTRAGHLGPAGEESSLAHPSAPDPSGGEPAADTDAEAAFRFGVQAIVTGVAAAAARA